MSYSKISTTMFLASVMFSASNAQVPMCSDWKNEPANKNACPGGFNTDTKLSCFPKNQCDAQVCCNPVLTNCNEWQNAKVNVAPNKNQCTLGVIDNPAAQACSNAGCNSTVCCKIAQNCEDWTKVNMIQCGQNRMLKSKLSTILCQGAACNDSTCCQDLPSVATVSNCEEWHNLPVNVLACGSTGVIGNAANVTCQGNCNVAKCCDTGSSNVLSYSSMGL
eukprot:Pgem_evm1s6730